MKNSSKPSKRLPPTCVFLVAKQKRVCFLHRYALLFDAISDRGGRFEDLKLFFIQTVRLQRVFGAERAIDTFFQRLASVAVDIR